MTALAFAAFPLYLFGIWKWPLLLAGLAVQSVYLVSRGIALGRLPLVGPHDTLMFLAASLVAFSLPFHRHLKGHRSYYFWIATAAAVFTAFALAAEQHNTPLPPVLKTLWFELHVVLAFLSYGLFGVGAVLGALFLRERAAPLEGMQYRAVFIGYSLFSLSMIFGGVWAFLAWGTYWLWTPKELWTALLWLFYSLYLHARLRPQWRGRPAAVLGVAGFAVVLFTYLGVSLLMKSSHSF